VKEVSVPADRVLFTAGEQRVSGKDRQVPANWAIPARKPGAWMAADFKSANTPPRTRVNQSFLVAHREGNGQAEWREKQAGIIVIIEGNVMIVYGGTVVNGKPTTSDADDRKARLFRSQGQRIASIVTNCPSGLRALKLLFFGCGRQSGRVAQRRIKRNNWVPGSRSR